MSSNKIKVSIITCVYNGESTIENAIKSVINQIYDNIEYIVIDGGSTDSTVDIIKKYDTFIKYWISEPDKGIGDAWNKGIKASNGVLIGLLNADDIYHKTAITNAVEAYNKYGNFNIFYGTCKFIFNNTIIGVNRKKFDSLKLIRGFSFVHTTCFVPKYIYDKIGLFDHSFKVAVDAEFLLRCHLFNIPFQQTSTITYMQVGGISDKKSKIGYFEYINLLVNKNIISKRKSIGQKFIYSIYSPFRSIFKSQILRYILRQAKHILTFLFNYIYKITPTFTLKNLLLNAFGIQIGKYSYIHPKTVIYTINNLKIGDYSVINPDSILDNRSPITIGHNVSISHGVRIYTNGHDIFSPFADMVGKEVIIEDYVIIFANVMIMPGITIGRGAVIYPGSIVTKNVAPLTIVGGNPAVKIKMRDDFLLYNNDYGFTGIIA